MGLVWLFSAEEMMRNVESEHGQDGVCEMLLCKRVLGESGSRGQQGQPGCVDCDRSGVEANSSWAGCQEPTLATKVGLAQGESSSVTHTHSASQWRDRRPCTQKKWLGRCLTTLTRARFAASSPTSHNLFIVGGVRGSEARRRARRTGQNAPDKVTSDHADWQTGKSDALAEGDLPLSE